MAMNRKERRKQQRAGIQGRVQLSWTDPAGTLKWVLADCLDASREGLRVLSNEAIPEKVRVNFEIRTHGVSGSGSVRFCRRHRMKYQIGIEMGWGQELQLLGRGQQSPIDPAPSSR